MGQFFDDLESLPFFMQEANLTFDHEGDEMPPNRNKIIHPTGTVALFKFVSYNNHDFTGSLKGTENGILRISEVGSVKPDQTPSTSAGFKFLRDGVESANMMTLHNFAGHETFNFLAVDYNTHVDLPTNECNLMTSHAKLATVSRHIGNMSVKGLSDYDQYGNKEENPKWPFKMRLKPHDPCGFPDQWHGPFTDTLTSGCIPSGTLLFSVFAHDEPEGLGGREKLIGAIITTSDMVTSSYGDARLFFRHKRFEEDLEERPEWKPFV